MNLKKIRNQLMNITDHAPTALNYQNDIDDLINQAYNEVWTVRPWLFTIREAELKLYPDITPDTTDDDVTISVDNMTRQVSCSAVVRDFMYGWNHKTWENQPVEIEGREYQILSILSNTEFVLKEPFRSTNDTPNQISDWTIKHRWYRLPEDCVQLLSFVHTDRPFPNGSFSSADSVPILNGDRFNYQNETTGSYATHIFRGPDLTVPPGEQIEVNWSNTANTSGIPASWVEFTWSFEVAGRYGPLSESSLSHATNTYNIAEVVCLTTDLAREIEVLSLTDLDSPYPSYWEGLRKVLWFNANIDSTTGTRLGTPCWVAVTSWEPNPPQNSFQPLDLDWNDSSFTVPYQGQLHQSARRYLDYKTQQIRPYPRVNASDEDYTFETIDSDHNAPRERFKRAIIRYLSKPQPLALNTDSPAIPDEFSNAVIYKALENLFVKLGDTAKATYYQNRFNVEIKGLERRFLNSADVALVRRQFGVSNGAGWFRGPVDFN